MLLALSLACGCSRQASDLREWKVSDHDHTSNPGAAQVEVKQDAGSPLAVYGIDEVTVVAWEKSCATCHGAQGAGDGPQGPITKARDLTDAAWHASVTDESIAQTIRNGRGMMPPSRLPEATVQSLVRLVRLLDPRRRAEIEAKANPSATPSGAAAPSGAPAASAGPAPSAKPVASSSVSASAAPRQSGAPAISAGPSTHQLPPQTLRE
jgi:mono/diheme cytochrome c family protein